ncbi:MAG: M13 family metallopeptidase [Sediminibacterium sp. Gen4]|jgi:putative endopeptidase|uniref:M13 family metallopeptidase n=1 Tax=unclassified Sediminibacterium TaxID=2635961 RepID=UPI0015BD1452|nr:MULTISPECIES: M13 family metallopeptidase [unclassified Sediminibacterium]MBW0163846.1 M13 family metallopeptidase [Sediminibacterium sp.]NWK66592.1 M13 family metallopeptidase [Sediminibacterium sp. Gen4]
MKQLATLLIGASLAFASCKNNTDSSSYFDTAGMDTSVHPGDNFFMYANGTWIKNSVIPDDQSGWGSFYTLYDENLKKMRTILDELSAKSDHKPGSNEQKVGDFYASGMDTAAIEKAGYDPLKPMLAKIDAVKDHKELISLLATSYTEGDGALIGIYVGADERNSAKNILSLYQTGLTLPEKDYYTKTDAATAEKREKLIEHITNLFVLTGVDKTMATQQATAVLKLETAIAASHLAPVELRDPIKNYNKMSVTDLQKMSPNINWSNSLQQMGIQTDSVNVAQPAYYKTLSALLASQSIDVWKSKVKFDYISSNASLLSKAFVDERFSFNKLFSGAKTQEDRWKKMVNRTDNGLKDLLGQIFVQKYFPGEAKKRMDELVNNLQIAFDKRIAQLDWMSDTTKQKAKEKLSAIMKKIGYPDQWKSYDDVTITRTDFYGNMRSIAKHDYKESIAKIGKPVDKTEWQMTAPTVNAYYNPTFNEIVFPAGILQFPFFELKADDAINYGAIGMVIGHEMTHGFDDQGRQYDAQGNLTDWWTKTDAEKFTAKAKGVIDQYNAYTVLDSLHVNGALTLGENLADIGGLAIAYDAFKLTQQGKGAEKIDGFTPDQRFFLGYAQVWRLVDRPESMRTRITTDPHSPEEFRVNGPLANFEPFYQAFGVTEKHRLYRPADQRARIW